MFDTKFQDYYANNAKDNRKVSIVSGVYIEECLTSASLPQKSDFQVTATLAAIGGKNSLCKIKNTKPNTLYYSLANNFTFYRRIRCFEHS